MCGGRCDVCVGGGVMCVLILSQEYVMECVVGGDDEEEMGEPSSEEALAMAEKLNDRRVLLAGFLKLAMFSAIEMKIAAPIFAEYFTVSVWDKET